MLHVNSLSRRIIAPSIILGIGLIPTSYGYKYARMSGAKVSGWTHRTAVVVDQIEVDAGVPGDSTNGTVIRAILEYEDAQLNIQKTTQLTATGWSLYPLGTEVELLVNPDDQRVAVINSFLELWALPTLFFMFASPFVLLGTSRLVRGVIPQPSERGQ